MRHSRFVSLPRLPTSLPYANLVLAVVIVLLFAILSVPAQPDLVFLSCCSVSSHSVISSSPSKMNYLEDRLANLYRNLGDSSPVTVLILGPMNRIYSKSPSFTVAPIQTAVKIRQSGHMIAGALLTVTDRDLLDTAMIAFDKPRSDVGVPRMNAVSSPVIPIPSSSYFRQPLTWISGKHTLPSTVLLPGG